MALTGRNFLAGMMIFGFLLTAACQDTPQNLADEDGNKILRGDKVDIAEFPNISNSIFGGWTMGTITNSMPAIRPQIFLNSSGKVVYSMACPFSDGVTLYAKVTLDSSLIQNHVVLSHTLESTYNDGIHNCTARVGAGTIVFTVEGGRLHVNHMPEGDTYYNRLNY